MLRLAIRSREWDPMNRLLEANLVEHRIEAALDAPDVERFSTITARTVLMGGTKSPAFISQQLVTELAAVIPSATVAILPGLDHLAAQQQPSQIATTIHPPHSLRERPPLPRGRPEQERVGKPADAPGSPFAEGGAAGCGPSGAVIPMESGSHVPDAVATSRCSDRSRRILLGESASQ